MLQDLLSIGKRLKRYYDNFFIIMDENIVREILNRLPMSNRDQDIIFKRIYHHKKYNEIADKFRLSKERIRQIEQKFWRMLWGRSLRYERYYKEKEKLEHGVYKYRLYNPEKIKEILDENYSRRITEYDFSIRAVNCLYDERIKTIDQLITKTEEDLLRIRKLGKKCIQEIRDVLSKYGYSLKREK